MRVYMAMHWILCWHLSQPGLQFSGKKVQILFPSILQFFLKSGLQSWSSKKIVQTSSNEGFAKQHSNIIILFNNNARMIFRDPNKMCIRSQQGCLRKLSADISPFFKVVPA